MQYNIAVSGVVSGQRDPTLTVRHLMAPFRECRTLVKIRPRKGYRDLLVRLFNLVLATMKTSPVALLLLGAFAPIATAFPATEPAAVVEALTRPAQR